MRVTAYTSYTGVIQITAATPRIEPLPSTIFTAASIHEDYCASVRNLLREYKHVGDSALSFPAAQQLQTYFPQVNGKPVFALRELMPAGSPRDIDAEWQLEVMRIRYQFHLLLLPPAFQATDSTTDAIERHIETAVKALFQANNVPDVFIPGDSGDRPNRTEIDIVCELGPAGGRTSVDIPTPAGSVS